MPFPFVAIAVSLVVSAATSAAAAALAPSQKIDKGGLNDLSVAKSSYGETIPQCWGQIELAGNLIWATKIKEVTETQQQGGSGAGATVTDRSYFGNFAIAFAYTPHRSAEEFVRIKLNGKTVYDPTNPDPIAQQASNDFASQYLRFYYGTSDQQPDPLIQNTTPVQSYDYGLPHDPIQRANALTALGLNPNLNHVPAYRYKVYVVFENLPLKDYSNSIPAVKAEILFNTNNTLETIITDLCTQVGITSIDTSLIANISVPGFYLDRQIRASEALRILQQAYFFDIIKSGDKLRFISESATRPTISIPLSDLGASESGQNKSDTFALPKPDPYDLPESVEVNFLDLENSYDNGNVIARSQVAGSKKKESYSFPLVMDSAQAQAIADILLHKFYLEAMTLDLDLPPKYCYLEVGDRLEIQLYSEYYTWQIIKIQMGANRLLKLNTKLVDAANLNNLTTTTTISTGGYNPPVLTSSHR
jgi:Putative phage tail protein